MDDGWTFDELRAVLNPPNPYLPDFNVTAGWQENGYVESWQCKPQYPDPFPGWYQSMNSPRTLTMEFVDVELDMMRALFGIPPGFPLWYRPERPALTVGPIGRYNQQTQCLCGHDETRHIVVIGECLGGACDCTLLRLRSRAEARGRWRKTLLRRLRR
jgi:hypothetical protein